jgi:hypothetical protein
MSTPDSLPSVISSPPVFEFPKPVVKEIKQNYGFFVIVMLGLLFLLSSISYMKLLRNITNVDIQDPYLQKELKYTQTLYRQNT